jgi:A/G-specific adenine glycosylase
MMGDEDFKKLFEGINHVEIYKISNPMKHVLSHRVIYAQFITIRINELNSEFEQLTKVSINEIDKFAVSRLMELFLEKLE